MSASLLDNVMLAGGSKESMQIPPARTMVEKPIPQYPLWVPPENFNEESPTMSDNKNTEMSAASTSNQNTSNTEDTVNLDPNAMPYMIQHLLKNNELLNAKLLAAQSTNDYYEAVINNCKSLINDLNAKIATLEKAAQNLDGGSFSQ